MNCVATRRNGLVSCALLLAAVLAGSGCEVTNLPNAASDPAGGRPDGRPDIQDGSSNTIVVGEDPAAGGRNANVRALTTQLSDKRLEFGHSSFFSSGSITESDELVLCGFGRFGMRITRITSTSFDTFSSESTLFGTWSINAAGGGAALVLQVDDASDRADLGVRQLAIQLATTGAVLVDGERATVTDAAGDCAAARQ